MNTKILAAACLGTAMLTSTAFASPLHNYSLGMVHVGAGVNIAPIFEGSGHSISFDKNAKKRVFGEATVGLGGKFAVQFKYSDAKCNDGAWSTDLKTQEYNLLYKLGHGFSLYGGVINNSGELNTPYRDFSASRTTPQVGVQFVHDLLPMIDCWANVGVGSNVQHYEAGVSWEFLPSFDLNLSYNYQKAKIDGADFTAKGPRIGISFKF